MKIPWWLVAMIVSRVGVTRGIPPPIHADALPPPPPEITKLQHLPVDALERILDHADASAVAGLRQTNRELHRMVDAYMPKLYRTWVHRRWGNQDVYPHPGTQWYRAVAMLCARRAHSHSRGDGNLRQLEWLLMDAGVAALTPLQVQRLLIRCVRGAHQGIPPWPESLPVFERTGKLSSQALLLATNDDAFRSACEHLMDKLGDMLSGFQAVAVGVPDVIRDHLLVDIALPAVMGADAEGPVYSALVTASLYGLTEVVHSLLRQGVHLDNPADLTEFPVPAHGIQAIHVAKNREILQLLLAAGANVNQPSSIGGVTPLMMVASFLDQDWVRLYLDAGADPTLVDGRGNTAIHYANMAIFPLMWVPREQQRTAVVDLLEHHVSEWF